MKTDFPAVSSSKFEGVSMMAEALEKKAKKSTTRENISVNKIKEVMRNYSRSSIRCDPRWYVVVPRGDWFNGQKIDNGACACSPCDQ